MDYFGETNSRNMPGHFFWDSLHLDHASAVRADVSRQNYSVCPRYWYIDATFNCRDCREQFHFSATEQKHWYEELGFYVDSYAKSCPACRRNERRKKQLRQQYDRVIDAAIRSADVTAKSAAMEVIDELVSMDSSLPAKIHENRKILANQLVQLERGNGG